MTRETKTTSPSVREEAPAGSPGEVEVVAVAVAVNREGRREVLGIALMPNGSEAFWSEFLRGLTTAVCAA